MNIEMLKFAQNWAARTEEILKQEIDRLDVKDTEALRAGLRTRVDQNRNKTIITLRFKSYGRFVDIGTGFRTSKQTRDKLKEKLTGKKPKNEKRWYSPTLFGRLYDLYGVIGYNMVEKVIKTKEHLTK